MWFPACPLRGQAANNIWIWLNMLNMTPHQRTAGPIRSHLCQNNTKQSKTWRRWLTLIILKHSHIGNQDYTDLTTSIPLVGGSRYLETTPASWSHPEWTGANGDGQSSFNQPQCIATKQTWPCLKIADMCFMNSYDVLWYVVVTYYSSNHAVWK